MARRASEAGNDKGRRFVSSRTASILDEIQLHVAHVLQNFRVLRLLPPSCETELLGSTAPIHALQGNRAGHWLRIAREIT